MKARLLILLLTFIFSVIPSHSQSLCLRHRNGKATVVALSEAPIVRTAEDGISITSAGGTKTFDKDDVLSIVFQSSQEDVNRDYNVDISDVVSVINTIAGSNAYQASSDVNGDKKTDISDIVAIINSIAGKSETSQIPSFEPDHSSAIGEAIYIYRNDGEFNAFLRYEVENISFADGTSLIQTTDSIYKIPLAIIDSLSFIQPEKRYAQGVIKMDPLISHITSTNGMEFCIAQNTPSHLIPHNGDVLLYEDFSNPMFPLGFAGKVRNVNNLIVSCDSVSFADLYESYTCIGDYTLEDSDSESGIKRLKRKDIDGRISAGLNISEQLGNDILSADINGKLELELRVVVKFEKNSPLFFEISLSPHAKLGLSARVKGSVSGNFLDFLKLDFRLPIPDTPLLLGITGGPSVKPTLSSELSVSTEGELSFLLGIKYVNGNFKPICKNTSKGFSEPKVEGNIDGKLFMGIQTDFGIYSYGDIFSTVIKKEAGIEIEGNLSQNMRNSDKYEELTNGNVKLNLVASFGAKTEVKLMKFLKLTEEITLGSVNLNINTWPIVPTFTKPEIKTSKIGKATVTVVPSGTLIRPVGIGIGIFNEDNKLIDKEFCNSDYRKPDNWSNNGFVKTFSGLSPNKTYKVAPIVRIFDKEIKASPFSTFKTEDIPVKIKSFEVTKSQYKKDAFLNDEKHYSYRYEVATTVECISEEGLSDWGYVYEDSLGKKAYTSLKSFGSPYTDTRYAYFRNVPVSSARLYGYVKYEGDDKYYYGEPHDYDLIYEETSLCPDSNHPHAIDLGIGVKWSCCNVGASAPWEDGGYYAWGETEEKSIYSNDTYAYFGVGKCNSIGSDIAGTKYDVAHVKWGKGWCMPNQSQMELLNSKCTNEWTTINGVNGRKYTGPNGASIFLPASGDKLYNDVYDVDNYGYYWSSTQVSDVVDYAHDIYFHKDNSFVDYSHRSYGRSVRPVMQ